MTFPDRDKLDDSQAPRQVEVVIGIVVRGGKILICLRRQQDPLGGYWEFPGGKREPGESRQQCLARELLEEVGVRARPVEPLASIQYDYPGLRVFLHPYVCDWIEGEPTPWACQEAIWVAPDELPKYRFPAANEALIKALAARHPD